MKAIINGLMYDTTNSKVLYSSGEVTLWKTQHGSYFMISHQGITPMSIDEVKEYLGVKDADMYVAEFGEVEEA